MNPSGRIRLALVASVFGLAILPAALWSASFTEFVDPNPAPGNFFGASVVPLSTGNVVVTSPNDDAGGSNAGAVYLFNGSTGALISTLRGSTANDQVGGSGIKALTNGNFVVISQNWDNGAAVDAGAVTWGSGTTGVSGIVSAANSLVGSSAGDAIGNGGVFALTNGNYVVASFAWDDGAVMNVGAVTWGSGTAGVSGAVSAANSLVGSTANDQVGLIDGFPSVATLSNGNYVVSSIMWDNGATIDAGAATWGSGTAGVTGTVSAANSLVGSTLSDQVGFRVFPLSNGNYVVSSSTWDNGGLFNAGAATWGNGTTGVVGTISAANSLVGGTADDLVGLVTALANGNYVVVSASWDNGATANVGAVTWANGTTGASGTVTAANSMVGTTAGDAVGSSGVLALPSGNYVVTSTSWDNGAATNAGAVTWMNGTVAASGTVSPANSLVGSTTNDQVGQGGGAPPLLLTNGNYVVRSSNWDNGAVANVGAVTWASGTAGVVGAVSAANSLVGSTASDQVGFQQIVALTNGNYVVRSLTWDNGGVADAGAATWGNGATGVVGTISSANSLVGTTASDGTFGNVVALANGNYVVMSPFWNNGAVVDAGAATWGNGATGVTGTISAANSLVGSTASDQVGSNVTPLSNGNYVVRSHVWNNGAIVDAGAVTWGNGVTGVTGTISAANSLVGSTASDQIGPVTALPNGDYVVTSASWNNGATTDAGAATWGSGGAGVVGAISSFNSIIGGAAGTNLAFPAIVDAVNNTFYARFTADGGGRVRVGPTNTPIVVSAIDVPADQGGWLRITFLRSSHDDGVRTPPVSTYGVWRKVPGAALTRPAETGATRPGAGALHEVQATLPGDLVATESGGRLFVSLKRPAEASDAFPSGTWELVTSVPAVQQSQYVVATPTLSNAAANEFVVTAHTTTPAYWIRSSTISGQSVDNLAPSEPTGLSAGYSGGQTQLQWNTNPEPDLGSYSLHRGASAGFTPTPGNRIALQIATSFADVGPAGGYYKLSARDVNGNESTFALITPDQTTGVGDGVPVAFALEGARPNPAAGTELHVAFALPSGAPARLELLDVSGRLVVAREVGSLGAGRHTMNLAEGRGVRSGIYWIRLTQGTSRERKRVAVVE